MELPVNIPDFTLNDFIVDFPPTLLISIADQLAAAIDNESDMSEQYRKDLQRSWELCYFALAGHIGHLAAKDAIICPENL